jgi:hypothetical protein
MRNYKKLMSLAMAGVMTLSLAVPAFASDGGQQASSTDSKTNTETEVKATYTEIPIAVTVPKSGTASVNPYGLPVKVASADSTKTDPVATIKSQQITSQPLYITNDGDTDLSVGATVTTTTTGNLQLVSAAPSKTATEKQAFVYLEMKAATTESAAATLDNTEIDKISTEFAGWTSSYNKSTAIALSADEPQTLKNMVTLKAKTQAVAESGTKDTDDYVAAVAEHYGAGSIAMFRLAGTVVQEPEEAWATTDGFTATIAFSFTPST